MSENMNLGDRPSLKQLVYQTIKNRIIRGEIAPGTRLAEDELAASMNISRAPVREALSVLEQDGLTKNIPRKGAVVTEVNAVEAREIWECRAALEPYAAKLALPHIPPEELETVFARFEEAEKNPEDYDKYIASDLEVHELYYRHLNNEHMKALLKNLEAHATRVRWLREIQDQDVSYALLCLKEHREILEAFRSGDPDRIYAAVQKHLVNSGRRIGGQLEQQP